MADQALTVGLPYGLTPSPATGFAGEGIAGAGGIPSFDPAAYSRQLDAAAPRFAMPSFEPVVPSGTVAYSPSTNKLFVNGQTFDADDDTAVLNSLQYMRPTARTPLPPGDWESIDTGSYLSHAQTIADPSTWQLVKKNFGIGVDNLQLLTGYGLQYLGGKETGQGIVDQQLTDLSKSQVYQREFTSIGDKAQDLGFGVTSADRGVFDWFVANFAQQGPNLIESIVTGAVGFVGGAAVAGGPGAASGAIAALVGKESWKQGLTIAAQKYMRGEALDAAETKLLREASSLTAAAALKNPSASRALIPYDAVLAAQARDQAERIAIQEQAGALRQAAINTISKQQQIYSSAKRGAVGLTLGQNIATGISDIYGETLENADGGDRLLATALGIPYGLLESATEFLAASRVFGIRGTPQWMAKGELKDIKTLGGKTIEVGRRFGTGFVVGGTAEGLTELGQEGLGIYANDALDINSPEGMKRVINAFAAGFGVGGPMGGLANLRDNKQPVNLLDSSNDPSPPTGTSLAPVTPPQAPPGGAQGEFTPIFPGLPPPPPPMLGGPTQPVMPSGGPMMMVTPDGVAYPDQMLRQTGNVPPGAPGTQGVLDVFGGNISAQELASRMQPNIAPQLPFVQQPQPADPRQGALQFAPPAPTGPFNNQLQRQLQQMQDQRARDAAFQQAEATAAAQRAAELEQLNLAGQNQRQLDIAFPQETTPQTPPLPMIAPRERTPQQMSLFRRGELPRPSRGEGLRRGVGTQIQPQEPPAPTRPTPGEFQRAGQLSLFTQQGDPTVAALRSVAKPQQVVPTLQAGATQAAPTGAAVTPASVASARAAQNLKRGSGTLVLDGATYSGQLKNGSPNGQGTLVYDDGSTYVGKFKNGVPNGQGRFEDMNGTIMDGEFTDGQFEGEVQNAVQERSTAKVDARKPARDGKAVGARDTKRGTTAGKGEALKTKAKEDKQEAVRKDVIKAGKAQETVRTAPKAATLKKGKAAPAVAETKAAPKEMTAEEQWEDKKPENAPAFNQLSPQNQQVWRNLVTRGRATMADADLLTESYIDEQKEKGLLEGVLTPLDVVNEEINNVEEATTIKDKAEALTTVVQYAFFSPEDTNTLDAVNRARDYLKTKRWDTAEQKLIDQIVLSEVNTLAKVEAVYTRGDNKGVDKPWFQYAQDRQLLPQIATRLTGISVDDAQLYLDGRQLKPDNFPADTIKKLRKNGATASTDSTTEQTKRNPASKLLDYIQQLNSNRMAYTAKQQQDAIAKLKEMYAEVRAQGLEDYETFGGNPISAYFDGSTPKTRVVNGKLRVYVRDVSDSELRGFEAEDRGEVDPDVKIAEESSAKGEYVSPFSLDDWNAFGGRDDTGRFERDDGTPITNPVPLGKIKMLVANFLSKLTVKPRTFIYKNQADLKTRNPELYARAAAARTQGDFDNVSAVAYSFDGDTVIVFSDRVATEQQLNFVLAHEAVGHNGLRSLIDEKQFNSLMEQLYKQSPAIQSAVDASMAIRGQSKAEATEEYLADFAAQLETNVLSRVWNAIKGALNKLGLKFGDEAARFFVSQARRYTRSGETAGFFDAKDVARRMVAMETAQDIDGSGRFAQTGDMRRDNLMAGLMMDSMGGLPQNVNEAVQKFIDKTGNISFATDKFIAKFFSLTNFRARENAGLSAINDILNEGKDLSMNIKVTMKEKLETLLNRAVVDRFNKAKFVGGITTEELQQLNSILYDGLRYKVSSLGDFRTLSGEPLFSVNDEGQLTPNQKEIDRLYSMGLVTFDQAKNGYSFEIDTVREGQNVKETIKVPGIKGLTEDSKVWQGYLRAREAMRDVEIQLLKARYLAYVQDKDMAFREIADITQPGEDGKTALTNAERRAFERIYRRYKEFYTAEKMLDENGDPMLNPASIQKANDFIAAVNAAIIGKDTDRNAAVANFYDDKNMADDTIAFIQEFKKRLVLPEDDDQAKFTVQNRLKDIIISEVSNGDADLYTKRTLATGYTPILRQGGHQVRVTAKDAKGRIVTLKQDYKDQLVYSQFEGKDEAVAFAREINSQLFGGKGYKVEVYNEAEGKYVLQEVYLEAVPGTALDAVAAPPELNLNEFVRGLRQFNITMSPQKMEGVITALTKQNARARQRLLRAFNPGASTDGAQAIMQHIESRASTIAKVMMRPRLTEVMNRNLRSSQELWNGSKDVLNKLKKNWEDLEKNPTANLEERTYAKRKYERYAYMYNKTNEGDGYQKANQYYNEAAGLLAFLDGNRNVDESDFGSGEVVSSIRAYTSMMQLGLSVATGALNYIGAFTNGIPYLASYNSKTAFGGGFGAPKSMVAFLTALNQVGFRKALPIIGDTGFDTAEFYDKIAASPDLQNQYGIKEHEARFLAREIREGVMIPAQSNALTATARGRATSGAKQKFFDGVMWTFNSTEQASRRGLGLASYRLAYERAMAAHGDPKRAAAEARDFAVDALKYSLGEYSVLNRPAAWRSGIQSFIYMYKVFPTTSIQMLARLDKQGQAIMLTSLFVMSGLMGLPFAEDFEDIFDTIAQKLGWTKASIRYEMAKVVDQMVPGASPYILRGFLNALTPADLAARVELGNFIPGTGALLAGSDVSREVSDILGPAWSMLTGVATTIPNAVRAAFTDRVSVVDVLRESPVTMGRALGDLLAYDSAGAIIDRRGYVISRDVHAGTLLTRALGFYPQAASQQYEFIRTARRVTDYQREVSAGYQHAWIKARISNDAGQRRAIEEAVREWNRSTYGTPLFINNFQENAAKAYEEARRPATQRFLRTAPKASRTDLKSASEILAY
jgi:hypothetical protein